MRSKIGYRAVLAGCLLVLSWYLLSCGGSAHGGSVAPDPGSEPAAPVAESPGQAELAFPPDEQYVDPGEILARRGSWAAIARKAGNDVYAKSTNTALDDPLEQISLNPDGAPAGAWAVYRFLDIVPTDLPLRIDAEFTPGSSPEELYIGISNYAEETWHWSTVGTPAAWNSIDLPAGVYPISPGGSLYVVVCVLDPEPVLLESVLLGASNDVNRISGFLASAGTETDRVVLTWNRPSSADGYLIEYMCRTGGYPLGWNKLAEIDGDWNLEYDHLLDSAKPAERFEHYRYRIKATLAGDTSRDWVEAEGFVGSQVQGFSASDGEFADQVHLTWDPILGCDGYRIEYRISEDTVFWPVVTIYGDTVDHYDFFGSTPNIVTTFRISMIWDGKVTYWTMDEGYSGLVHFDSVEGFTASTNEAELIRLRWDALLDASSYRIEYRDELVGQWAPLATIPDPGINEFLHKTDHPAEHPVQPGLPTSYRITGIKGEQVGLSWAYADGICGLTEIGDVEWFNASQDEADGVVLRLGSVTYADSYVIEYRNLAGGSPAEWSPLVITEATYFEHTQTAPEGRELDYSSYYEYRVAAVHNGISSENWATDIGYASPLREFTASDGLFPDRIELEWICTVMADLIRVEYRNTSGGEPVDWALLAEFANTASHGLVHSTSTPAGQEAQAGVDYEYRVKTIRGGLSESHGRYNHGYYGAAGPGAWTMAGRDSRHTRRSEHLGPQTADLAWSADAGQYQVQPGSFALDDYGNMYFGTSDGLCSLSRDGEVRWNDYGRPSVQSPAITASGEVLGAFFGLGILAYDPAGGLLWAYPANCAYGSVTLADDGAVIFGDRDGLLTVLDPDGTYRWSYPTGGQIDGTAAVADDGTIYIYSNDGNLYALTPAGGLLWSYDLGEEPHNWRYHSSPAISADGTVYIGGHDGRFHALNPDGSAQWVADTGGVIVTSPALSGDGTILTACGSAGLVALDPTGTVRWSFVPEDFVHSSPAVDAAGNVYFNCHDGNYFALTSTGDELWRYNTRDSQGSDPTLADGVLYGTSYGHYGELLALGGDN